MPDELPIMEKAQQLMERGEIPEDVTRSLQWAGMIHVYKQAARTNGRVTRLEIFGSVLLGIVLADPKTIFEFLIKLFS